MNLRTGGDNSRNAAQPAAPEAPGRACGACLTDLFRTLKTFSFYPKDHPVRRESLDRSHRCLTQLLNTRELFITVSRSAFTVDGTGPVETTAVLQGFASDLFIRRVKKLLFLPDLSPQDLQKFLLILTVPPEKLLERGGIEKALEKRLVKTVWVNELDLSAIAEKRRVLEERESLQGEEAYDAFDEPEPPPPDMAAMEIEEAVAAMEKESDDSRYFQLAGMVVTRAQQIPPKDMPPRVYPLIKRLLAHHEDLHRSLPQREHALFTMEQLLCERMLELLLARLEDRFSAEKEAGFAILRITSYKTVPQIIQRLSTAETLNQRKMLAMVLVDIGDAALPFLLAMLRDPRWYVVRNIVSVIGEIRSPSSARDLAAALEHENIKVRKEAIRSLTQIGGEDAEKILLSLVADRDVSIRQQVMLSLGILRSRAAVPHLLEIVEARDLFLETLPVKLEAVRALGRIGDRRATQPLARILNSRHLFGWRKWQELRSACAAALGQIGDENALDTLRSLSSPTHALGRACSEAMDMIERLARDVYEQD